jgi:hypothetical protein
MEAEPRQNPVERKAGFWNMSRIEGGRPRPRANAAMERTEKTWPQKGADGAKKPDWFLRLLRLFAANPIADLR